MSNQNIEAALAILSGVHQRLQAEMRTVEGVLRMLAPQAQQQQTPQRRNVNFLGADTPQPGDPTG